MTARYNKNGIRVLDDPKENHIKKRKCMPDEHIYDEGVDQHNGTLYVCEKCGEKDFVSEPIDEQNLPWL